MNAFCYIILNVYFVFKGYTNPLKVVYSQSKKQMSTKGASRYIPQAPDRILDAPEIVDDYCKYEN